MDGTNAEKQRSPETSSADREKSESQSADVNPSAVGNAPSAAHDNPKPDESAATSTSFHAEDSADVANLTSLTAALDRLQVVTVC